MSDYTHTDKDGDGIIVRASYNHPHTATLIPRQESAIFVSAEDAPALCKAILARSGSSARVVEPGAERPVAAPMPALEDGLARHEALQIAIAGGSYDSADDLVAAAETIRQYLSEGKK